jgi:hypothetical protein
MLSPEANLLSGRRLLALSQVSTLASPIPQADFPDLAIIDKFINEALAHPHIHISEL